MSDEAHPNTPRPARSPSRAFLAALAVCMALGLVLAGCDEPDSLAAIRSSGTLVVLSENSSHGYYQYQDQSRGFEYELARAFAGYLGVRLQVVTPPQEKRLAFLSQGSAQMIAAGLHVTEAGRDFLDYSVPYRLVQQELVVNRFSRKIRTPKDFEGLNIHVRKGSFFEYLLRQEAGNFPPFTVVAHPEGEQELFLEDVNDRHMEATVADHQVALLARRYYPDIHPAFSFPGESPLAWAVKKGDRKLLAEINRFLVLARKNGTIERIWNRYYRDLEDFDYLEMKRFHRHVKTRLPQYKDAFVDAARKNGFDWRLLAAVSYQESRFDPHAESTTGVQGLMQLTGAAAAEMGVGNRLNPRENLRAGAAYLRKLYDRFPEVPEPDRLFLALASYNAGYGTVLEARRLAQKKGLDPDRWADLCKTLTILRSGKRYEAMADGFSPGPAPVRYVRRVLTYYEILARKAVIFQRA